MMLMDKDKNGHWTDYIYANGKKIARLESSQGISTPTPTPTSSPTPIPAMSSVTGLHMHGTANGTIQSGVAGWLLNLSPTDDASADLQN